MDAPMDYQHNGDDVGQTTTMLGMQVASLSVLPMALKVAIELDVFKIIAKAQKPPSHRLRSPPSSPPRDARLA